MARLLHRLGFSSARHRRVVIGTWLLLILALFGAAATISKPFEDGFSVPGTESHESSPARHSS